MTKMITLNRHSLDCRFQLILDISQNSLVYLPPKQRGKKGKESASIPGLVISNVYAPITD